MNSDSPYQPPRDVPDHVKFLLGLASDASRAEITEAWQSQVIPLIDSGPKTLFDREALQLMASGLTGDQARRIFKQTRRGAKLWEAAQREGTIRARKAAAKPPFVKGGPGTAIS